MGIDKTGECNGISNRNAICMDAPSPLHDSCIESWTYRERFKHNWINDPTVTIKCFGNHHNIEF